MESTPEQVLEQFLADIGSMKRHASKTLEAALKKPLLLLLLVSRIENGQVAENPQGPQALRPRQGGMPKPRLADVRLGRRPCFG